MKNKKIILFAISSAALIAPVVLSASCEMTKEKKEFEEVVKKIETRFNSIKEKAQKSPMWATIEPTFKIQEQAIDLMKTKKYKTKDEYIEATKAANIFLTSLEQLENLFK
ncbi:hypothetical protein ACJA25_00440 [Mycoplasmopsis hyopharyngis]|uniref:hypothetical protein n=1 Tax=Mycoplasmopsis hyopharyngis TaxID=29558 RepID=UPI0038739E10